MKFGLVILLAENKAYEGKAPRYSAIKEMAQYAERSGFDSIWLYDHLLYRPPERGTVGIWECWTILAALAEATQTVQLGTLVLCNSFRNPAMLAKMAITLDEVSNGRVILGVGAGWNKPEYDAFGFPFNHRVDRFEEALQIIQPLLKTGKVDFKGSYYAAENCEITPWGPRSPGPPLMTGAFGPRMLGLTAQYADAWNTAYLGKPDSLKEPLSKLKEACASHGRDLDTLEITGTVALVYPEQVDGPIGFEHYLTGTPEELVEAFHGYQKMGISHLMFHCVPYTRDVVDRLARAVALFREQQKA